MANAMSASAAMALPKQYRSFLKPGYSTARIRTTDMNTHPIQPFYSFSAV